MEFKARLRRLVGAVAAVTLTATVLTTMTPGTGTAAPAGAGIAAPAENIYLVKNGNTGRCLTANNLQAEWNDVFTRDCVNAPTQKWWIADGYFVPQGSALPPRCLDAIGTTVFTWPCEGATTQSWRTNGSPTWIRNAAYIDMCLHSTGGPNAPVVLNTCGSASSRWVTVKVG